MKPKHILITGASGTVGREIVTQLSQNKNARLYVFDILNKKTKRFYEEFKNHIHFIAGDISNETDIAKIPAGMDAAIHLAAIIPPAADDFPELAHTINTEGTRLLVRHLEDTSPDCFFMYSSSVSVYGDRLDNPDIRVGDALVPSEGDLYAVTKIEAEKIIRASRLLWTIFRLTGIMKNHKISRLMFHMPLDTPFEISTPEDTARAFINGLEKQEKLSFRIFNLGGGAQSTISYREFLQRSFDIYGLGKLAFPEKAFAEKNFHCGRMVDGDELENILHFRKDTMESYLDKTAKPVSQIQKILTFLVSPIVKWFLLRQSEPYQAWKTGDISLINRFFKQDSIRVGQGKKAAKIAAFLAMYMLFASVILQAQAVCNISNIKNNEGQLCFALFENQKQFDQERPVMTFCVTKDEVKVGRLEVKMPDLAGSYGITVMDDADGNGRMKYKLLRIPAEGFGFSDYIHKGILKPVFDKFKVIFRKNEKTHLNVRMQYY